MKGDLTMSTMQCPNCHRPSKEGARFCHACGTSLTIPECPACHMNRKPERRFTRYPFSWFSSEPVSCISCSLDSQKLLDPSHAVFDNAHNIQRQAGCFPHALSLPICSHKGRMY